MKRTPNWLIAFMRAAFSPPMPGQLQVAWWKEYNEPSGMPEEALLLGFIVIVSFTNPTLGDVLQQARRTADPTMN